MIDFVWRGLSVVAVSVLVAVPFVAGLPVPLLFGVVLLGGGAVLAVSQIGGE